MEPPDDDGSISLLGEALEKLMAAEDEQSEEPIQVGDTMEFHRYMDLPFHVREKIREEAIDEEYSISPLATVSKEWQKYIENVLFNSIRLDPSVEEDVLTFKQLFKNQRRRYLATLEIILDDRPTGPWHTANGIVQINLAMEKVGMFFHYLSSWDPDQTVHLEINFVSVDSEIKHGSEEPDVFNEGYARNPTIRTTSLWTKSQLDMLGNSNAASDKPLWAIWSKFPKSFGKARSLTFPLDCVPLPTSMAIIETMPNLEHCSFELAFEKVAEGEDEEADKEGMARLAEFFEKLPTLASSLRELDIWVTGNYQSDFHAASSHRLSAALRDSSQSLRTLKVEGLCLHQNFFESFGEGKDLMLAKLKWNWPNLQELDLQFVTFGPAPGPFSKPDQLSLTPTKLLIAAGRATITMPRLRKLEVETWDDADGVAIEDFSISRELPSEGCRVKLNGFSKNQAQWILCAWAPFLRAKARLVSEKGRSNLKCDKQYDGDALWELPTKLVYQTSPEEYSLSTTLGAGALVNNASFLEVQRLVQAKSSIQSVPKF